MDALQEARVTEPLPTPAAEDALAGAEIPGTPPDLGAALKAFILTPDFSSFAAAGRTLIGLGDFPPELKKESEAILNKARSREEFLMLSDAFQSYEVLADKLPEREDAQEWARNRAGYPELYTVLGIVCAAAKLLDADRMLTQRVLTVDYPAESAEREQDLKKRLFRAYETQLLPRDGAVMNALEREAKEENSVAVTNFLKGYLAPLFELERGIKIGFFGKLGRFMDEERIPEQLNKLENGGLTPEHARFIRTLRSRRPPEEKKDPPVQPPAPRGASLKQIAQPRAFDESFLESVLHAQGSDVEKVLFLHGVVTGVSAVTERGLYALAELLPRGVKLRGTAEQTGMSEVLKMMNSRDIGKWNSSSSEPYDVPLLLIALSKVDAVANRGYFNIAKTTISKACTESCNWGEFKEGFRSHVDTLIDALANEALKRKAPGRG